MSEAVRTHNPPHWLLTCHHCKKKKITVIFCCVSLNLEISFGSNVSNPQNEIFRMLPVVIVIMWGTYLSNGCQNFITNRKSQLVWFLFQFTSFPSSVWILNISICQDTGYEFTASHAFKSAAWHKIIYPKWAEWTSEQVGRLNGWGGGPDANPPPRPPSPPPPLVPFWLPQKIWQAGQLPFEGHVSGKLLEQSSTSSINLQTFCAEAALLSLPQPPSSHTIF